MNTLKKLKLSLKINKGIVSFFGHVPPPIEFDHYFNDIGSPNSLDFSSLDNLKKQIKMINYKAYEKNKVFFIFKKINSDAKDFADYGILEYSDYAFFYDSKRDKYIKLKGR